MLKMASDKIIHSGHFMVSCLNEDEDAETSGLASGDFKKNSVESTESTEKRGYNFENANWQLSRTYLFGNRSTNMLSLDPSLTKMFECMTLAYSGKLVSPKWKNFRGIKVKLKDKIRLNNIIWREWHMQFRQKKKPIVCQFETPVSDRTHAKPEAVVMEGKYWKRRLQCVTNEYVKWRRFFKDHFVNKNAAKMASHVEMLDRVATHSGRSQYIADPVEVDMLGLDNQLMCEDDYGMDFSDTLFSSLNQPWVFPDPKEISQFGFADFIQPGLIQLQPNFDEFMDTVGDHLMFTSSLTSGGLSVSSVPQTSAQLQHDSYISMDEYFPQSNEASMTSNSNMPTYRVPAGTAYCASSSNNSNSETQRADIYLMESAEVNTNKNSAKTVDKLTPRKTSTSRESQKEANASHHTILQRLLTREDVGSAHKSSASTASSRKSSVIPKPEVNEFHKNMLKAAASQAVGLSCDGGNSTYLFNDMLDHDTVSQQFNTPFSAVSNMVGIPETSLQTNSSNSNGSRNIPAVKGCWRAVRWRQQELKVKIALELANMLNSTVLSESNIRPQANQPRTVHLSAEYKRRCNIKTSFELLNRLVPALNETGVGKINKATTLIKASEFCKRLKAEREEALAEMDQLRAEIESFQSDISCYQAQLPASGAPVMRAVPQSSHMTARYDNYVRIRTLTNWKFWIFSLIIRSLFNSFCNSVMNATTSDELCQRSLAWLEQHCSLIALRPVVLDSLRNLSTTTSILTDPTSVPQQATKAVQK